MWEETIKVGILGGTFNPLHNGHIELGQSVLNQFNLDRILYVLSAKPPHKSDVTVAPVTNRWDMLQIGLASYPCLCPSDIEMKRKDLSWTITTVEYLMAENSKNSLYFISGSEGFLKIQTWKNYRRLLSLIYFIVIIRRPEDVPKIKNLVQKEKTPILNDCNLGSDFPKCGIFIHRYESDLLSLSSTHIRALRRENKPIHEFVNNGVLQYIERYRLYEG